MNLLALNLPPGAHAREYLIQAPYRRAGFYSARRRPGCVAGHGRDSEPRKNASLGPQSQLAQDAQQEDYDCAGDELIGFANLSRFARERSLPEHFRPI
jgi:hypothetical protein